MSWAISNKPTFQGPRYANAQDRGQQTQRPRQEGRPPSTHSLQRGERLALGRSSKSTVKRLQGLKVYLTSWGRSFILTLKGGGWNISMCPILFYLFCSGILFSNKILGKTQYITCLTVEVIWPRGPARGPFCILLTPRPCHSL